MIPQKNVPWMFSKFTRIEMILTIRNGLRIFQIYTNWLISDLVDTIIPVCRRFIIQFLIVFRQIQVKSAAWRNKWNSIILFSWMLPNLTKKWHLHTDSIIGVGILMYIQNIYSRASSFLVRENAMILFKHKKSKQTNKSRLIWIFFLTLVIGWLVVD